MYWYYNTKGKDELENHDIEVKRKEGKAIPVTGSGGP
jgi:hypothetical protein